MGLGGGVGGDEERQTSLERTVDFPNDEQRNVAIRAQNIIICAAHNNI